MKTTPVAWAAVAALAAVPAQASFHRMQIEQVIGGVAGDVSQQAVQLRMREGHQNLLAPSRLIIRDAAGVNPVILVDFGSSVAGDALGDRVLIASPEFAAAQDPAPDFVMTSTIPPAYFDGGQLSFETDSGQILFALCWGSYSGLSLGTAENDNDGDFSPCEAGPLPHNHLAALRFTGSATATSTNNAADFALTTGTATFTNNAGSSATLVAATPSDRGGDCNDNDPAIFPGQAEVAANRIDDDCDGLADEDGNGVPSSDPNDGDGDGWTLAQGDCDDTDAAVRPGQAEVLGDRRDNDCDGFADEDASGVPSFDATDHDEDGFAMFPRVYASGFEP
jgi:hypothetical protein